MIDSDRSEPDFARNHQILKFPFQSKVMIKKLLKIDEIAIKPKSIYCVQTINFKISRPYIFNNL